MAGLADSTSLKTTLTYCDVLLVSLSNVHPICSRRYCNVLGKSNPPSKVPKNRRHFIAIVPEPLVYHWKWWYAFTPVSAFMYQGGVHCERCQLSPEDDHSTYPLGIPLHILDEIRLSLRTPTCLSCTHTVDMIYCAGEIIVRHRRRGH